MSFWLRLVVSVAILGVLVWVIPWADLRAGALAMDWSVWVLVVACFLIGHNLGAMKWRIMVNIGRSQLGAFDAVRCYAAGLFANLCLPSIVGGDVLRATIAARITRRGEAVVWGSIADRLVDIISLGLLIVLGSLVNRATLPGSAGNVVVAAVFTGVVAGIVGLVAAFRVPLRRWPRRIRRTVGRTLVAMRRMARSPRTVALALTMSLIIQGGFVLLNAWIGRALGIDVPIMVWFFVWPLAKLSGLIPVSLNGLGVRDATQGALLLAIGVPAALGVVASLVWQSVLVAGGLLAGFVWWALGRVRPVPGNGINQAPNPSLGAG